MMVLWFGLLFLKYSNIFMLFLYLDDLGLLCVGGCLRNVKLDLV